MDVFVNRQTVKVYVKQVAMGDDRKGDISLNQVKHIILYTKVVYQSLSCQDLSISSANNRQRVSQRKSPTAAYITLSPSEQISLD